MNPVLHKNPCLHKNRACRHACILFQMLLFLISCLKSGTASSQLKAQRSFIKENPLAQAIDTIQSNLHQKPSLVAGFDSRYSFIGSGIADIMGVKLGIEFGNKFYLGISGHELDEEDSPFYKAYTIPGSGYSPETVMAQLQIFYLAPYAQYVFYNSKHWRLSIPVQLGFGESNYLYTLNSIEKTNNMHALILLEPFLSCEYKINNWFSISSEFGLRLMLLNNPAVAENMNSPTFSLGISLDYSNMISALFPKSQIAGWLGKL